MKKLDAKERGKMLTRGLSPCALNAIRHILLLAIACMPLAGLSQEGGHAGAAANSLSGDTAIARSFELDSVTVTAKHITHTTMGYKALIASEKMFESHTLLEAMTMLPGLFEREGKLKAYGKEVEAVYVNGKRLQLSSTQLTDYLNSMEAKNIASVEVENPNQDRKHIDGGGYVLKIRTRHLENGGMATVGLGGSVGNESQAEANPSANVFHTLGKLSYYVYARYTPYSHLERKKKTESDYLLTNAHRSERMTFSLKSRNATSYAAGIGYDFTANHSIAFNASGNYANRDVGNSSSNSLRGETAKETLGEVNTHYRENTNMASIDYKGTIGRTTLAAYAYAALQSKNDRNERLVTQADGNDETALAQHLKKQVTGFAASARWRMGKWQSLLFSMRHADWKNTTDAIGGQDYTLDQYRYKEHSWNGKVAYTQTIGKLTIKGGMEWSYTAMRAYYTKPLHDDYNFWLPTATLNYVFNEEKGNFLQLNYEKTYMLPSFQYQSPHATWWSEYEQTEGNPVAEPDVTHTLSLTTQFSGITLVGSYSYNKGLVRCYSAQAETGVILTSIDNGSVNHELNLRLALPTIKPCKGWMLSPEAFYIWNHQAYQQMKSCYSQTGIGLTSMNDLPWKVSMTLSGQFSTSQRSLFVKHGESADFSASFARSFLKSRLRLSFSANCSLPSKTILYDSSFTSVQEYVKPQVNLLLSLRYSVNWGERPKTVNQNQESNLLRL